MKDEEWGEAERVLITVQELVARLLREASDKTQESRCRQRLSNLTEAKGRQCSPTNALRATLDASMTAAFDAWEEEGGTV